jgi:hypothetical protein
MTDLHGLMEKQIQNRFSATATISAGRQGYNTFITLLHLLRIQINLSVHRVELVAHLLHARLRGIEAE